MERQSRRKAIWVYIEVKNGKGTEDSFALLNPAGGAARLKGCRLVALVVGSGVEEVAWEALRYGADAVLLLDHPDYQTYRGGAYAGAIVELNGGFHPECILLEASPEGTDLAYRLSQAMEQEIVTSCEALGLFRGRKQGVQETISYYSIEGRRPQLGLVPEGIFGKNSYRPAQMGDIVDGAELLKETKKR